MDDRRLIEEGLAGRLSPDSAEFERFVEITARRPSGDAGAAHYRDPKEHEDSFVLALEALDLTADDRLLELCFGGGQVLERALETVPSAAGIDHSPDLVSERPEALLAEVRRVLAPGGRFVLLTAVREAAWNSPWAAALLTYEPETLRSMLLRAGFAEATVDESSGQQLAVAHA